MFDRTLVFTMGGAIGLAIVVLEMVRRRRLREEYSLLWLVTTIVTLALASSRGVLETLAATMGIFYPPSVMVVVGFGVLLLSALHFSAVVSRLTEENKVLAQEVAMLRHQVQTVERAITGRRDESPR
jgi:hypothetical protein